MARPLTKLMRHRLIVFLVSSFLGISLLVTGLYFMAQWKKNFKNQLETFHTLGHSIAYKSFSTSLRLKNYIPCVVLDFEEVSWAKKEFFQIHLPKVEASFSLLRPSVTHIQFNKADLQLVSVPYRVSLTAGDISFNNAFSFLSASFEKVDFFTQKTLAGSLRGFSCHTKEGAFSYTHTSPEGKENTLISPALEISMGAEALSIPLLDTLVPVAPLTELTLKFLVIDPVSLRDLVKSPIETIRKWKDENGFVELTHSCVKWGKAEASGEGTLALDENLCVEAAGSLSLTHISEILKHLSDSKTFGLQETIVMNLTFGLMQSQDHIFLPLTLQEGVLSIGSFLKIKSLLCIPAL